jgi:hypothetical protein
MGAYTKAARRAGATGRTSRRRTRARGIGTAELGDRRPPHFLRLRHAVALRVVDAEAEQDLDDPGLLGPLGDRLLALHASRTNYILSSPMLLCMAGATHGLPF